MTLHDFVVTDPSDTNVFRSIVLFGRNVATYKFALATSLLDFAQKGQQSVSLAELAVPYSAILCDHLKNSPKQGTSSGSKFLTACNDFNQGLITHDELIAKTISLGFENVIDAFHRVGTADVPTRFFLDQRKSSSPSIAITPEMMNVAFTDGSSSLLETDARWSLVETAWALGLSTNIVGFDEVTGSLLLPEKRKAITSARSALNGYQKGRCFYCYRNIEIVSGSQDLADVDHLFPHVLQRKGMSNNLDGVWNLVLACQTCNRGEKGKFDSTPALKYIERLNKRNEYLILSAHPLRETLIYQTGENATMRRQFLQANLDAATQYQSILWETPALSTYEF
jgi:5-methylcytosine-specific restriction endonuclease McrA